MVTETIEVAPHTYEVVEETLPTAEKDGKKLLRCTVCGAESESVTVALGIKTDSDESAPEKSPASEADGDSKSAKDSILLIIIAVSATIALLAAVAFILIRGGRRRIAEASREAAELLEAESATAADEAEVEAAEPANSTETDKPSAEREDVSIDFDVTEK